MGTQERACISEEEYLKKESVAETKSEYYGGEIVDMAGAQDEHNLIVSNIIYELNKCAREKEGNCIVYPSDMLLKLKHCKRFVYPDVMMVCEKRKIERDKKSGLDALLNPIVIVEVLSESTRHKDQVTKRDCYLELKSLKQYVLVDSQQKDIIIYSKNDKGEWIIKKIKPEEKSIIIEKCAIQISDVYRNIEFE